MVGNPDYYERAIYVADLGGYVDGVYDNLGEIGPFDTATEALSAASDAMRREVGTLPKFHPSHGTETDVVLGFTVQRYGDMYDGTDQYWQIDGGRPGWRGGARRSM